MRRTASLLVVVTSFICSALLLSLHQPTAAIFIRIRRRLVYGSSYQADLHCDGPDEYKVPDSYSVFLHPGYSLSQHKRFLSDDIDLEARITHVFWEDTDRFPINYYADLDDGMLDSVRRDWGVDFIECEGMAYIGDPVEDPED